ncbi:MAG: AbrB/MazE/SpoVT family DNA-binding domain-containing protein [Butyricicoccus porcorum]
MKSTGIVRRVDELGRIVLPKELRDTMGIPEKTPLEICVNGDDIILRKYGRSCVCCGADNELLDIHGHPVCEKCARKIAAGLKE